jgi:hypothetical protein
MGLTTRSSSRVRGRSTDALSIRSRSGVKRLVTTTDEPPGAILSTFVAEDVLAEPNRYTVQVSRTEHAYVGYVAAANHSCDPNVIVDTATMTMVASRSLAKGEELLFFYPSTEWHMAAPFPCGCGSEGCIGLVAGACFLPTDVLERYVLNVHIRSLLAETRGVTVRQPPRPGSGSHRRR